MPSERARTLWARVRGWVADRAAPRRWVRVRQHDASDCGAACLAAVAGYHDRRVAVARARQLAGTDRAGTTLLGLADGAARLGLAATGVRGGPECLARVPLPAIAHLVEAGGAQHYVVLHRVTERTAVVMDPADGRLHRTPRSDFERRWSGVLLLVAPAPCAGPIEPAAAGTRRLWALVRPHRTVLGHALAGAVVHTLLGLATSVYVQKVVDHVIPDGNRNLLDLMTAVLVGLLLVQAYVGAVRGLLTLRTAQRIDGQLVTAYYAHLLRLPQRFFDTMRVGEIVARVNDAVKIRAFVNDVALDLVLSALVVALSLGAMALHAPRLALLALGVGAVLLARLPERERAQPPPPADARRAERGARGAARGVRRRGVDDQAVRGGARRRAAHGDAPRGRAPGRLRLRRRRARGGGGGRAALAAGRGGGALGGEPARARPRANPRRPHVVLRAARLPHRPARAARGDDRAAHEALVAAERLFEIMDLACEEQDGPRVELAPDMVGDLRFERVSARYGGRRARAARRELRRAPRALTAIVGESGSGKSTLAGSRSASTPSTAGGCGSGPRRRAPRPPDAAARRRRGAAARRAPRGHDRRERRPSRRPPPTYAASRSCACAWGGAKRWPGCRAGSSRSSDAWRAALSAAAAARGARARSLHRPGVLVLDEATSALDGRRRAPAAARAAGAGARGGGGAAGGAPAEQRGVGGPHRRPRGRARGRGGSHGELLSVPARTAASGPTSTRARGGGGLREGARAVRGTRGPGCVGARRARVPARVSSTDRPRLASTVRVLRATGRSLPLRFRAPPGRRAVAAALASPPGGPWRTGAAGALTATSIGGPRRCCRRWWRGGETSRSPRARQLGGTHRQLVADHLRSLGLEVRTNVAKTGWWRCCAAASGPRGGAARGHGRAPGDRAGRAAVQVEVRATYNGRTSA
jgi:ATP-binding cassette subfamily B protein